MIYHLTDNVSWQKALATGFYQAPSLHNEGFIHASALHQVAGVRDRYFKNKTDLILLHIDESKIQPELKYELAPSVNELFPHIYGPINVNAVVRTSKMD